MNSGTSFVLFCFVLFCFVLFCFVLFVKRLDRRQKPSASTGVPCGILPTLNEKKKSYSFRVSKSPMKESGDLHIIPAWNWNWNRHLNQFKPISLMFF
jgi:hypothetical protein